MPIRNLSSSQLSETSPYFDSEYSFDTSSSDVSSFGNVWSDDDLYFLQNAESILRGTDYENLFKSNPYSNVSSQPGIIDSIFPGLYSRFDRDVASSKQAAKEYIAQLLQSRREEMYNSASSQASRERVAGINPDISGNVTPGNATEFAQEQTSPEFGLDEISSGAEFCQNVLSSLGQAFNFVSLFQDVSGKFLDNQNKRVGLQGVLSDLALSFSRDYVPESISGSMFGDGVESGSSYNPSRKGSNIVDFGSKRLNKRFRTLLNSYSSDYNQAYSKFLSDLNLSKKKSYSERMFIEGNPLYSETSEIMREAVNAYLTAQQKAERASWKSQSSEAGYQSEYFDNLDAKSAASAVNSENQLTTTDTSSSDVVQTAYKDFVSNLSKGAKEGGFLHGLLLFLLSMNKNVSLPNVKLP